MGHSCSVPHISLDIHNTCSGYLCVQELHYVQFNYAVIPVLERLSRCYDCEIIPAYENVIETTFLVLSDCGEIEIFHQMNALNSFHNM